MKLCTCFFIDSWG